MNNTFLFDDTKRIYIYGAGGNSNHLIRLFSKRNIVPASVIDKRASDIEEVEGIGVITPAEFFKRGEPSENTVIIISIKNVFEHINIARIFLANGYDQLIYKPYGILQGKKDDEWNGINNAYESLAEKGDFPEELEIPTSNIKHLMSFDDEAIIERREAEVVCYMPFELISNYIRDDSFQLMPMGAFYPILDMYKYLLGEGNNESWDEICNRFYIYSGDWLERTNRELTDGLKKSMIQSRLNVFGQMQQKADRNRDFFRDNCVKVKRNGSIYFLESSGRNRVSFMIARGMRYIPVRMTTEEYNEWVSDKKIEAFKTFLDDNNVTKLYSAVPNPHFYSFSTKTCDYERLFCMPVIKDIYMNLHTTCIVKRGDHFNIDLEEYKRKKNLLRIVTLMKDDGIMGRLLRMHGFICERIMLDDNQIKISKALDELSGISQEDYKCRDAADIMVLDLSLSTREEVRDSNCSMIYCVGKKEDFEKQNTILETYRKEELFFHSVWEEKVMLGVIYKKRNVFTK